MLKRFLFSLSFAFSSLAASAQLDPAIVPCIGNHFWSVDQTDTIREWQLVNNVVSYVGPVTYYNTSHLAYGKQNTAGTLIGAIGNSFIAYTAPNWASTAMPTGLINNGSYNDHHFMMAALSGLYYSNGTTFNLIYSPSPSFSVADIAVDQDGLAWVFIGQSSGQTSTLRAIDSTGQVVHNYPLLINTTNAYGSFMMGGTIYLGIGPGNPITPNVLLPVFVSGGNAQIGTPIPFSLGNIVLNDLASCAPGGMILGINKDESANDIRVFPNPSHGVFSVSLSSPATYEVYSSLGELVLREGREITSAAIDLSGRAEGVYFLRLKTAAGISVKRLVVVP